VFKNRMSYLSNAFFLVIMCYEHGSYLFPDSPNKVCVSLTLDHFRALAGKGIAYSGLKSLIIGILPNKINVGQFARFWKLPIAIFSFQFHLDPPQILSMSCNYHFRFSVIVRDQLNEPRTSGGDEIKVHILDPEQRPVRHAQQDLQVCY